MPKMPGPLGGFNLQAMMKQVQKLAEDTERMERELAEKRVEATAGGGMVKATVNGLAEIVDIAIDPQVVDPDDVEMLQDLVVSAVREATERSNELKRQRMQELTGGLGLPPGIGLPGL